MFSLFLCRIATEAEPVELGNAAGPVEYAKHGHAGKHRRGEHARAQEARPDGQDEDREEEGLPLQAVSPAEPLFAQET